MIRACGRWNGGWNELSRLSLARELLINISRKRTSSGEREDREIFNEWSAIEVSEAARRFYGRSGLSDRELKAKHPGTKRRREAFVAERFYRDPS